MPFSGFYTKNIIKKACVAHMCWSWHMHTVHIVIVVNSWHVLYISSSHIPSKHQLVFYIHNKIARSETASADS